MKFDTIVCDPPWTYSDHSTAGERGVHFKYPTMTIEDIKALPINDVASDEAVLFLWGTWPLLSEAMECITSWGFEYKTIGFIWIKLNKVSATPFWGMGNWTRSNSEYCLLATKGNVKAKQWRQSASVHSVIQSPIMNHSKKPVQTMERIEELVRPDSRKLEIFATERRDGWESLGFSVNDDRDIRDTLPELIAR